MRLVQPCPLTSTIMQVGDGGLDLDLSGWPRTGLQEAFGHTTPSLSQRRTTGLHSCIFPSEFWSVSDCFIHEDGLTETRDASCRSP